jgi:hypothetical protein
LKDLRAVSHAERPPIRRIDRDVAGVRVGIYTRWNAERDRLIDIAIVEEVLMVKAAYLAQAHDAVSGRLAHELAGITDPGLIRTRLLAEMREIRAGVAEHTLRTADAIDRIAQDVEHRDAAAEPDGEPVGGSDAAPAGRKRRARKVAKQ